MYSIKIISNKENYKRLEWNSEDFTLDISNQTSDIKPPFIIRKSSIIEYEDECVNKIKLEEGIEYLVEGVFMNYTKKTPLEPTFCIIKIN